MNIHLKTATSYLRRSPFQSLAVIFVLVITFFVATIVSTLIYSSTKLINYYETRPQVIAFVKDDATEEQVTSFQNLLSNDPRVKEVKFVSKEEALTIYKRATSSNPLLGELVSPTIFPASVEFSLVDLASAQEIIDMAKGNSIVASVGFTAALGSENDLNNVVAKLKNVTTYIRIGGITFVGLLTLASFILLVITLSLRVTTRKEEVEILGLIGASKKFISSPIIIEAFIYSVIGVTVGWALAFITILYTTPSLVAYFGEITVLPRNTIELLSIFGIMLGIELVIGFVISLTGSLFALSRANKKR